MAPTPSRLAAWVALLLACVSASAEEAAKKIGIIGLDTSHVVAFTMVFNKGPKNPADAPKFAGFRVTHAFAQGSKDIPESTSRVPEYTEKLKGMGVEIVDSIEKLCAQVDFVLLESNDGRVHLEQVLPVLKAGSRSSSTSRSPALSPTSSVSRKRRSGRASPTSVPPPSVSPPARRRSPGVRSAR
ncbi:MAG: hypothetical protein ACKOY8_02140 [Verrucomicrobiota bacterium]